MTETFDPLTKLSRDLKDATRTMTSKEARWLVDLYYTIQDDRKRSSNQINAVMGAISEDGEAVPEPHEVIHWVFDNMSMLEANIKRALEAYTDGQLVGRWLKSIMGIGPVLSAGLLAHTDIEHCPTAGHLWRYAGLDPTVEWLGTERAKAMVTEVADGHKALTADDLVEISRRTNRKLETIVKLAPDKVTGKVTRTSLTAGLARRPWNARLRVLCWRVGESFVKVSGRDNDTYGKVYLSRKAYEVAKNEALDYAEQAAAKLARFNIGKDTEAYKWYSKGKLPPAHIYSRAKRYAVKLFLSHYQHVLYEDHFGVPPPKPYILTRPEHTHFLAPPGWPMS